MDHQSTVPQPGLSAEQLALLTYMLEEEGIALPHTQTIPPRGALTALPLSFAQQRLWFLEQFEPGSSVYNLPAVYRLHGPLNVRALEQGLGEIVQRHEVLRTTVVAVEGNPVQVIAEHQPFALEVLGLGGAPEAEREAHAIALVTQSAQRPFDLSQGPLLRATLVQLAAEEHVLLLNMHHIVSDGWSMNVLFRELATLYGAFVRGQPSPLGALPIQYADFAVWQRQWLQGENLARQLSYWQQQLSGSLPVLELPTDHPRPAVQTFRGARWRFALPRALSEALTELSQRQGVTVFMTLLAALQTLLYRYTGQSDIVVGSPIANRNRPEIEGLIGFFVNTLVLRTDLSGHPTFRALLGRVREVALEAYAHQDMPFEKLVEELQPARYPGHTPLFQVLFVFESVSQTSLALSGLTVEPVSIDRGISKFDLTLSMGEAEGTLRGGWEYNTDLFEPATIMRLSEHFQTLLEGLVAQPEQRVATVPLLTAAERQQLLVTWNATSVPYPREACIHELFEAQAARMPEAVAVVDGDMQLTYGELNRRANQVAHTLQRLGVGPDVLVGICMERSVDIVVGLLGILKAGGAYVPLDPTYPHERLQFMLADCQASVLVTHRRVQNNLPPASAQVVCLDLLWEQGSPVLTDNPQHAATAEHLAYVMYTSGSTGTPKGVAVSHRAVNRLVCHTNYVQLAPTDVVAQVSNYAFDAATFEIWGALVHGARLVMFTPDIVLAPHDFVTHLVQHGVTVLFLTTALFHQLARDVPTAFKQVRTLLFGGEAVEPRWVAAVLRQEPPEHLLHVYGPTEATTFASWYPVEHVAAGASTIPIGRPIAHTTLYLLDVHRQPVSVGVPGEVCIGGDGVARGYLHRPELTAEQFIPHPFSDEPGARLYKTGDLARYRPDGNIEFLGRLDHQVKLRGFRIELGEIEAVLRQHPAVRDTVVLVREDVPGEKRLVAYVVTTQPPPLSPELRSFVTERLPAYMVPAAFMPLAALPLTPTGKVDRRALPGPDAVAPQGEHSAAAVRDALEQQVAELWARVLAVPSVGPEDNFFALGGHSLLAVRLFADLERFFGRRLPLVTLFQAPRVAQLAAVLRQADGAAPASPLVALQPGGARPPLFCVTPAGGSGLGYYDLVQHLEPAQPFYALRLPSPEDGLTDAPGLEAVAAEYLRLVRAVHPAGPYLLGGYSLGGVVAFDMARQLCAQGQEVQLLALFDTSCPGRMSRPWLRQRLWEHAHRLWHLPLREHGRYVWARARTGWALLARHLGQLGQTTGRMLGRLGPGMGAPQRRGPQPLAAPHALLHAYRVRRYPGRITLFRAAALAERNARFPCLGWEGIAAGGVEVYDVPSNHVLLLREPHVRLVAAQLHACLDQLQAR